MKWSDSHLKSMSSAGKPMLQKAAFAVALFLIAAIPTPAVACAWTPTLIGPESTACPGVLGSACTGPTYASACDTYGSSTGVPVWTSGPSSNGQWSYLTCDGTNIYESKWTGGGCGSSSAPTSVPNATVTQPAWSPESCPPAGQHCNNFLTHGSCNLWFGRAHWLEGCGCCWYE